MKKKILRLLSLIMAFSLTFAAGCDSSGGSSSSDSEDSSSSSGGGNKPTEYEYGENWADER